MAYHASIHYDEWRRRRYMEVSVLASDGKWHCLRCKLQKGLETSRAEHERVYDGLTRNSLKHMNGCLESACECARGTVEEYDLPEWHTLPNSIPHYENLSEARKASAVIEL